MIARFRGDFNSRFTLEKYRLLLQGLHERGGTHVEFRVAETPCFFPSSLIGTMAEYGMELLEQLVHNPEYHRLSDKSIPPEFNAPNESDRPMFAAVDFGIVRDNAGHLQPKLVEIQGFPSLYGYQQLLSEQYARVFNLDTSLEYLLGGLDLESYHSLLRNAIVGDHHPENVVLLEIDPYEQKTLVDFLVTQQITGIAIVNITDVVKEGNRLYYVREGKRVRIERIYNRTIVDELVRKKKNLPFDFRDELDVEWAGHPNWFFRVSKFSIPFLHHVCVPKTWFLHEVGSLSNDLSQYVLKPLFSFAGLGVNIGPTRADINSIPVAQRSQYILQERMEFEPIIETPHGSTKAEIRVMYIWLEELLPVLLIVRMGRGKMMGVDHNKNMEWVGSSAGFLASE